MYSRLGGLLKRKGSVDPSIYSAEDIIRVDLHTCFRLYYLTPCHLVLFLLEHCGFLWVIQIVAKSLGSALSHNTLDCLGYFHCRHVTLAYSGIVCTVL